MPVELNFLNEYIYNPIYYIFILSALIILLSVLYSRSLSKLKKAELENIKVNENLSIVNKILRHDLMNKFVAIEYSTEAFEKFNLNSAVYDIRNDAKDAIKLIKQMKELELVSLNEKKVRQVVDIRSVILELEEINKIPIVVTGDAKIVADYAIRSVFNNLIRNAIIHGKTEKMDVIIVPESDYCMVEFKDYGTGIPKGYEEKIFDEGFSIGDKANTGIGLYIVKNRIEKYGGSIFAKNNDAGGASFIIKVPYE